MTAALILFTLGFAGLLGLVALATVVTDDGETHGGVSLDSLEAVAT